MLKPTTKKKLIFWSRMSSWVITACIVPIVIFAVRFGLFKDSGYKVTTDSMGNITSVTPTALSGWGIISLILICWTAVQILKEVRDAYRGYSLKKQCVDGVLSSLIPLIIVWAICYFLRGVMQDITYCLGVIIIFRAISIPLNPLPKWKYETKGEEDYSDILTALAKLIKSKMSKGGEQ